MLKTELRYSWVYNNFLNKGNFKIKELFKLKKDSRDFEILYKKNIKKIIKLIEKYAKNKKWQHKFIPIYIIKNKFPMRSFSDPLTLKYRNSIGMLIVLIHELIHNNFSFKKQIKRNYEKNEKLVNFITKKICLDLKLDLKNSPIKGLH